jgi:hypothetical protein
MKIVTLMAAVSFVALAMAAAPISAQAPSVPGDTTAVQSANPFYVLVGKWERPDGGYLVTINSVSADGTIDASYANPSQLPFSKAQAKVDGIEIEVFLELTAGGYNGSTYTLHYDADSDVLRGIYYQANAKQQYNIYFERLP